MVSARKEPLSTRTNLTPLSFVKLAKECTCPEAMFGDKPDEFKKAYRFLAKQLHEDLFTDATKKQQARQAFQELERWKAGAEKKLADGTYGDWKPLITPVKVTTKAGAYELQRKVFEGDRADIWFGVRLSDSKPVQVKVHRSTRNADLARSEILSLREIAKVDRPGMPPGHFIPDLLDSFELKSGRDTRVGIVTSQFENGYSLREVQKAHPSLDFRDAAWMVNRLVMALAVAHKAGVVHGAVTPDNFLIQPDSHVGVLVGWSSTVKIGAPLTAVAQTWRAIYPAEVFDKKPTTPGLDLFMFSKTLTFLMDGRPDITSSTRLPREIAGIVRACQLSPAHRINEAAALYTDLQDVLKDLYGPRTFRKFSMPER